MHKGLWTQPRRNSAQEGQSKRFLTPEHKWDDQLQYQSAQSKTS